ncbi:type II secretion system protein [Angustibacter aerolatus]|uniref:Type II secretion system protein n=1 Tax=Angustibacter aerolatus TaxID=1162965 RepID=A0ABQ6JNM7_9ACTN|nr:type II secretion system protein [Angustibacter aerolatus]
MVGAALLLLVRALTPTAPEPKAQQVDLREVATRIGRLTLTAIGVGLVVLLVTRWIAVAIGSGLLVLFWPALFGGARAEKRAMERLEGLATWTESLRDTIAGAVGLEQAIPATAYAAAPSVSAPLIALADRLRVRTPLPTALGRFADDMDDPSADLIVAALVLNSRLRGPGLRQVLGSLADSVRADLDMRRRIASGRASTRRSVQIVSAVSVLFVIGLRVFNPGYVRPYGTFVGRLVLALIVLLFAAGFFWLRRLSNLQAPQRFLSVGQGRDA